jgi:hypothetical protein
MADAPDTTPKRARTVLFDPSATWLPAGKLGGAAAIIAAAAVWADRITAQLDTIGVQVERLANEVHKLPDGRDMRAWVRELRAANPGMVIPEFESRE